jgi:hypothetical protein
MLYRYGKRMKDSFVNRGLVVVKAIRKLVGGGLVKVRKREKEGWCGGRNADRV